MRGWALAGCVVLLSGSLAAPGRCAPSAADQLDTIRRAGELVVGTEMQFAPFDFIDNGAEQGFNKDFFDLLGKDLGLKIRTIDLPWPSVLPGLEAGKFDVVAGPLMVTPARQEHYRFTSPIADGTVALLKRADDTRIRTNADIAGQIVGAGKGSAQAEELKEYVKTLPRPTTVREYIDNNQAYADLASGRIVAVANSLPNIAYVAHLRPDTFAVVRPAFGKKIYFAYLGRKEASSRSLLDAIDADIAAMQKDGRLGALQRKWFGAAMDLATPQEHSTWGMFALLLESARNTVLISLIGLTAGFVLAIPVCISRLSHTPWLANLGGAYVSIFRGVPLLVQLLLVYYFLPFVGLDLPPLVAAAIAVSLCETAYLAEILRGGLLGIPRGQREAAQLLGLSRAHTVWRIEVPQALRLTVPSLVNEAVMLVKASALISVVGVAEITRTAENVAASTYRPLAAYAAAGLVYLLINGSLSAAGHAAERSVADGRRYS